MHACIHTYIHIYSLENLPSKLDTKNIFSLSKMMSVTKTQRQENKKKEII